MQPTIILVVGLAVLARAAPSQLDAWESFKIKYEKVYHSVEEEARRLEIFQLNLANIIKHNELFVAKQTPYSMAVNKFTDMLPHEVIGKDMFVENLDEAKPYEPTIPPVNHNESVDWRKVEGVVSHVKDQGSCGSCWAFSATGALEGAWKLKKNKTLVLSEQQLVDCSYENYGCKGGWKEKAWLDIQTAGGIESEQDYPYTGQDDTCKFDKSKVVATVSGYQKTRMNDEIELKEAVAIEGPIAVSIYASKNMISYHSGVFVDKDCPVYQHNHAVLVVGYGHDTESKLDFWIVKNSWGSSFGEEGYIRMARNRGGMCSIAMLASFPTV